MTTLGIIFAGAYGIALFGGRRWVLLVLASSIAFNDSIVIAFGAATITPFYFGLILYLISSFTIWRGPAAHTGRFPGRSTLVFLFVYCAFVTALSPALFAGLGVISAAYGIDQQAQFLTPLAFTSSNVAQMAYLLLNIIFVWRSQRDGTFESRHVTIGLAVGAVVACSAFIGGVWPHAFFDTSPRGFYSIETGRLRGQFSEPSHLGAFAVTATLYFGITLARTQSVRRFVAYGVLTGMALALLYASASGTAAVGLGVGLLVMLAISLWGRRLRGRRLRGPGRVPVPMFLGGVAVMVVLIVLLPSIIDVINSIIDTKIGSTSLSNRSIVDQNSIAVFFKTFLLGAGNGSNRGSSLFLMLLSQIGLIGTTLFLIVVVTAVIRGLSVKVNVPAALALIGFLSAAFVSFPDFASPILWSLIAVSYSTAVVRVAGRAPFDRIGKGFSGKPSKSIRPTLGSEVATPTGRRT